MPDDDWFLEEIEEMAEAEVAQWVKDWIFKSKVTAWQLACVAQFIVPPDSYDDFLSIVKVDHELREMWEMLKHDFPEGGETYH